MAVARLAHGGGGRLRRLGLAGAALQAFLAVLLAGIAAGPAAFPNPPEMIPRGPALGMLYLLPAAIGALGALGAVRSRRLVVASAAILAAAGSILAFSGVTLVFLAPALLFATAAGSVSATDRSRPSRYTLGLLALVVPVAAAATVMVGILALPLSVLLVLALELIAGSRGRATLRPSAFGRALLAVGIVVLGIGAGWALLSMTETRCWQARQTSAGILYEVGSGGSVPGAGDLVAAGCDSGVLTPSGAGLAAVLALGAIGVAALASTPRLQS